MREVVELKHRLQHADEPSSNLLADAAINSERHLLEAQTNPAATKPMTNASVRAAIQKIQFVPALLAPIPRD
jgi:hypothetical protein